MLKPIFKWTGGKRREIKFFEPYFPDFVLNKSGYTYVEPFVGGGAVYFYLNNLIGKNIINDFDGYLINFYKLYGNIEVIKELNRIGKIIDHDELEQEYYKYRNMDKNNGLSRISDIENAIRFYVVNQLAFSGMRRFNSSGEFNVPFGHYKHLNITNIDNHEHLKLIRNSDILNVDFEPVMKQNDKKNTFIFLDPPYTRVFKKYSADNSFGEEAHVRLAQVFRSMKHARVMMIIDKSEFTESTYGSFVKSEYDLKYGVNIKNRFDTSVKHLIVCN